MSPAGHATYRRTEDLMRILRLPRLRIAVPAMSPRTRANGWVIGLFALTLAIIHWNTHTKSAGAYRGAVPPQIPDLVIHTPPAEGGNTAASTTATIAAGPKIEGKLAMRLKQALMLDAKSKLQTIPDYNVTFTRQERVGGKLLMRESTDLKVRHVPFSVYMKWNEGSDIGRELLYVEGLNGNRMLVKKGGQVGDMLPTFKLPPDGDIAMKESRYPVTTSGLLKLVEKILEYSQRDLKLDEGVVCQFLPDQKIEGRMCYVIRTDYDCAEVDQDYRTSLIFVDKLTALPMCVKNYGWSDRCGAPESANDRLTDETLIEFYAFTGIRYQSRLPDIEFDQANTRYKFHR